MFLKTTNPLPLSSFTDNHLCHPTTLCSPLLSSAAMPTLLLLLLLLPPSHSRKLLQDPFFPATPPANSPFSKYPFSSDSPPFFPQLPSPPPPPFSSSNQPTFPANLSSLLFPNSPSSSPPHPPSSPAKLAAAILLPFLFLSLLSLSLTFLLLLRRRRRRRRSSSSPKKPTFVPPNHPHPSSSSSPELRPLPPLTRQLHGRRSSHSEEEFYSPVDSASSSHKDLPPAPPMETCPSLSTTPSYPSSTSDPRSPKIGSRSSSGGGGFRELELSSAEMPLASAPVEKKPDLEKSSSFYDLQPSEVKAAVAVAPPPPPPPPPMPRAGYWESKIRSGSSSVVVVSAAKAIESSDFDAAKDLCLEERGERNEEIQRPKLKPLHWDKVRASSDRAMVWDQLKSSSFQVNEEMIESLFVCNGTSSKSKETNKQQVLPLPKQEKRPVLDPKKSQNIAILLRALNVTKEQVCEALLEGNTESLGTELLDTLLKMAPSKEEEDKLREYNDDSPVKLGPAEKFLKALLDIPFAFKRVDAMLYIINFDPEVNYLKKSFETLEMACEELRNSRLFLKLLEAVLKTGNRMNVGTNRGDARSFKLDTLLKLVDVKGTDGKTTLLHFVVQEVIRAEGSRLSASTPSSAKTQSNTLREDLECRQRGLQVIAGLGGELSNVKKSASMDSEVLSSYVSKLAGGISKVGEVLNLKEAGDGDSSSSFQKFHEAMRSFMKKAEDEIIKVQAQESVALSLVKEITEYFHGNSAKEEAHPFRIFMVVRDFLCILDQVCKEVGKITDRTIASSTRQFPVPVNPTLPSLFPKLRALRPESSDDDGSASPLSS